MMWLCVDHSADGDEVMKWFGTEEEALEHAKCRAEDYGAVLSVLKQVYDVSARAKVTRCK